MNCEEATHLISARVDGELTSGDEAALDAHLAGCDACRATLAEMELQDAALLRAFSSRQEAALELANRILQAIPQRADASRPEPVAPAHSTSSGEARRSWRLFRNVAGWVAAAAAGFVAAVVLVKPANRPAASVPFATLQPVARLTLATGDVFTSPSSQRNWRPIRAGAAIDRGAAVRTADAAKCELVLPDGSCVRLNTGTEARFAGDRDVQVSAGQIWSAVPRNAAPLSVSADQTRVTAGGAGNEVGTQFQLTCAVHAPNVTVQRGTADVTRNGASTLVYGGQILHASSQSAGYACTDMVDPLLAIRWQDELLTLKPADDPEVIARVNQLLARIATDPGTAGAPGTTEQEVRARGQAWSTPVTCFLQGQPKDGDRAARRAAARLLSDLATSSQVPDLIGLVADEESEVRYHAAAALRRLTGQTLGYSPDQCAATRDPAASAAWRKWWEQNKSRYPKGK